MVWEFRSPACGRLEYWPMAGITAGVVTEAQVEGLPGPPTSTQLALGQPATWTYIWVILSFIYLFGIYMGMINITRKR